MRIHNIYTDADGVSHFRDIEVDWLENVRSSQRSAVIPVTGMVFRQNGGDYALDWHAAPRRQYVINLDAGVKITVGDGESRIINAGEVILAEDLTGRGHLSESLGEALRHSILIHCD